MRFMNAWPGNDDVQGNETCRYCERVDEQPCDRHALMLGVWELDSRIIEAEETVEGFGEDRVDDKEGEKNRKP